MLNFSKDLRYAFRTLTKNPGFTFIGIMTLALGMAVNTTLFSVINGFLLRPLPVPHPEQIAVLSLEQSALPGNYHFSYPDYEDLRESSSTKKPIIRSSAASPVTTFLLLGLNQPSGVSSCPVKDALRAPTPSWFWDIPTGAGGLTAIPTWPAKKWK
jgi:hypothetical protein